MHTFKIGQLVWHGSRYWKFDGLVGSERAGWNTKFIPYQVVKITAKQIVVDNTSMGEVFHLKREVMERQGKQYHTRFHEYFYATKPKSDPEHRYEFKGHMGFGALPSYDALLTLGLRHPYTESAAKRAYRRLAKTAHPDKGGTSQEFTRLKTAYDTAIRFAVNL